jgi:acyl carrier protein
LEQVASGAANIDPATRLIEDLGLDSLALAELAEQIAVKAGRELSAEELANIATVDDLQRIVSERRNRPKLPSYARFAQPYTIELPAPLRRLGEARCAVLATAFDSWLKPRCWDAATSRPIAISWWSRITRVISTSVSPAMRWARMAATSWCWPPRTTSSTPGCGALPRPTSRG